MKIKKSALEDLLQACRNTYPNEFMAMLAVNKEGIIAEFVLVPTIYGKNHAIIRRDLIPIDQSIVGSIHSHPTQHTTPSKADLNVFASIGKIHIIAGHPYTKNSISVYDSKGNPTKLEVIE